MISLLIAFLLFVTRTPSEQGEVEYKIITTYETLYGNSYSGMVSQNGKIIEEVVPQVMPQHYIIKKSEGTKTQLRVDSTSTIPFSQIGTYGGFYPTGAAGNDIQVEAKLNEMARAGWDLQFVTSGAGGADDMGMMVTKYVFKRG